MKRTITSGLLLLAFAVGLGRGWSQEPEGTIQLRSAGDLDHTLGSIALYPDPLIAEILPAATVPAEIVLADRYLRDGGEPDGVDAQPWSASVKALAHYPDVLKMMDDNLSWTTEVGIAFLNQQQDVMDSIQRLRQQAQALGNLRTTEQQQVVTSDGLTEILPTDPEVVYVPVYQPDVVFEQPPPTVGFWISFGRPWGVGRWLNHDFDWHEHRLLVWHSDHPRPNDWWHRPAGERRDWQTSRPSERGTPPSVWRPHTRPSTVVSGGHIDRGFPQPPGGVRPRPPTSAPLRPEEQGRGRTASVPAAHQTPEARINPPSRSVPEPPPRTPPPSVKIPTPARVATPPLQRPSRPPSSGAFIGVQSAHDTRQFSTQGQASRQTVTHPAPAAPHPAPAPHSVAPPPSPPRSSTPAPRQPRP